MKYDPAGYADFSYLVTTMKPPNYPIWCTILLLCLGFSLTAQPQIDTTKVGQTVVVKMKNGDEYTGQLISQDRQTIVLQTVNGEIRLITEQVSYLEPYAYAGKFSFPNPHDTRYFFGPTGIPLPRRKGYYQNVLITTNFVNYGVADNIAIGGGFEFISTIVGSPIWFLTPKAGFQVGKEFYAGGGFIMAGFAAEGTATLAYGVATVGHSETNASLGVGYGLIDGSLSRHPSIMISGAHRVSNSIGLLTENYIFPNAGDATLYFGIHGIRIMSRKNAFDLGAVVIPEIASDVPALPFVGYVRVF